MSIQPKFKHYVWQLPVRICHWVNVLAIAALAVTGFFIGTPFSFGSSASDFAMGWIRFIHFTAAYAFTVSLAARLAWSVIGNEYSSWRAFFPFFGAEGRKRMVQMFRYYLFMDRKAPETVGHNPLATTAYLALFGLYLVMILTGFSLYAAHAPGGLLNGSVGFMYAAFSSQGMRLTHHLGMWIIAAFAINHVYSAWLMDVKEQGGEISSIFSGYKFTAKKEE